MIASFMRVSIPLALLTFTSACVNGVNECECFFADRAIALNVVDDVQETPIDDFFVELVVNGDARGEPDECSAAFREGNTCSFGDETGVYNVIVRAPLYRTSELVVRVAEESNSEICCSARLAAKDVQARLIPSGE
jgi:hypothetical protein